MSNQSSHLLLKNGTALIHGGNDKVNAVRTDILVSGSKISKIAANISPPPGSEVIDCTDNIISPGFVDTHHHVWQTLLKGRHANHTLMQYLPEGNFTSSLHTAEDTFWGQLAGCLEMIDCGTTSVVDFAHVNYSPEHSGSNAASGKYVLQLIRSRRRSGHLSNHLVRFTLRFLLLSHPTSSNVVAIHHHHGFPRRSCPS
jgi:cytosine/adenosine deaminase-related metal-dependent hydrolase